VLTIHLNETIEYVNNENIKEGVVLYMSNTGCGNTHKERDCCGLRETLAVILKLQENSDVVNETLATCDRPFLGAQPTTQCFNTRPIVLYTNTNEPWEMPIEDDCPAVVTLSETDDENFTSLGKIDNSNFDKQKTRCTSTVFRVEKLGPCTATFRVLIPIRKGPKCIFKRTNTFFTVNLCCFCAIRCLQDTFVAGIC